MNGYKRYIKPTTSCHFSKGISNFLDKMAFNVKTKRKNCTMQWILLKQMKFSGFNF